MDCLSDESPASEVQAVSQDPTQKVQSNATKFCGSARFSQRQGTVRRSRTQGSVPKVCPPHDWPTPCVAGEHRGVCLLPTSVGYYSHFIEVFGR